MCARPEGHIHLKTRHLSNVCVHKPSAKSQMKQSQIEQHHDCWGLARGRTEQMSTVIEMVSLDQCWRCWRVTPKIQKHWRGLQKAASCALTSHRLSSHAGIDFNIPLQWPSVKELPCSTLSKLHCCHTSQSWNSDIQPVVPFVSLLAPNTENALPKILEMLLLKFTHNSHSWIHVR